MIDRFGSAGRAWNRGAVLVTKTLDGACHCGAIGVALEVEDVPGRLARRKQRWISNVTIVEG